MCFITKCCIQWCLTKCSREIAVAFTLKNSTVASVSFPIIGEHVGGKTKICLDSCAECSAFSAVATDLWPVKFSASFLFERYHETVGTKPRDCGYKEWLTAFPLFVADWASQTATASSLRSF